MVKSMVKAWPFIVCLLLMSCSHEGKSTPGSNNQAGMKEGRQFIAKCGEIHSLAFTPSGKEVVAKC